MAALENATVDIDDASSFRFDERDGGADDDWRSARTEQLVDEFHESVYRYAYWLTGCRPSAEDVTQEVFIRAFRGLHGLRDARAARSWLMTITRNEFSRWCRKLGPRPTAVIDECPEMDGDPLATSENSEWVSMGLDELPTEFRLVVLMFYFEQLSYAEIADELSIPMGTVMSRLSRARKQLKHALIRLAEPKRH